MMRNRATSWLGIAVLPQRCAWMRGCAYCISNTREKFTTVLCKTISITAIHSKTAGEYTIFNRGNTMRILDLFKGDLKETRDKMAADLRRMRQTDRAKAGILLRRWRAGVNLYRERPSNPAGIATLWNHETK